MCYKWTMYTKCQTLSMKKECDIPFSWFLWWFLLISYFYYNELNKILLELFHHFLFFIGALNNFIFHYMVHVIFLLDNTDLNDWMLKEYFIKRKSISIPRIFLCNHLAHCCMSLWKIKMPGSPVHRRSHFCLLVSLKILKIVSLVPEPACRGNLVKSSLADVLEQYEV